MYGLSIQDVQVALWNWLEHETSLYPCHDHSCYNWTLNKTSFTSHPIFGLEMPDTCPHIPIILLYSKNTLAYKEAFDMKANELAKAFVHSFEKYANYANAEIL